MNVSEIVKDLIGAPYKVHGRTKTEGFDCYGLVIEVYKRLGKKVPDYFYDDITPDSVATIMSYKLPLRKLNKAELWSIMFINVPNGTKHLGIYIGNGQFIHALKGIGVCVTRIKSYQHLIEGYYALEE